MAGAAAILELRVVPRVRQPAVQAVHRSPLEHDLGAVGVAGQRVLVVRIRRQHDAVVLDPHFGIDRAEAIFVAAMIGGDVEAPRRSEALLDAGLDGRRARAAPAAGRAARRSH